MFRPSSRGSRRGNGNFGRIRPEHRRPLPPGTNIDIPVTIGGVQLSPGHAAAVTRAAKAQASAIPTHISSNDPSCLAGEPSCSATTTTTAAATITCTSANPLAVTSGQRHSGEVGSGVTEQATSAGYIEAVDPVSGRLYYVDLATQSSSWTKPISTDDDTSANEQAQDEPSDRQERSSRPRGRDEAQLGSEVGQTPLETEYWAARRRAEARQRQNRIIAAIVGVCSLGLIYLWVGK